MSGVGEPSVAIIPPVSASCDPGRTRTASASWPSASASASPEARRHRRRRRVFTGVACVPAPCLVPFGAAAAPPACYACSARRSARGPGPARRMVDPGVPCTVLRDPGVMDISPRHRRRRRGARRVRRGRRSAAPRQGVAAPRLGGLCSRSSPMSAAAASTAPRAPGSSSRPSRRRPKSRAKSSIIKSSDMNSAARVPPPPPPPAAPCAWGSRAAAHRRYGHAACLRRRLCSSWREPWHPCAPGAAGARKRPRRGGVFAPPHLQYSWHATSA